MIIIGLSGGVAAGKNFTAEILSQKFKNAPIFDADKINHEILENDADAIAQISKKFPKSIVKGKIDRAILGEIVFQNEKNLAILEEILHKKIRQKYEEFLQKARKNKTEFVVLNIPLLLESKAYLCDYIFSVITPIKTRQERFLKRSKNATKEKFDQIVKKQMADKERIGYSDFILKGDASKQEIEAQIDAIIEEEF